MIHLFSHSRGGYPREDILAITSDGRKPGERTPVQIARKYVRITFVTCARARGVIFRLRQLALARTRVLRNCRCQSSRRVDIARLRSLAVAAAARELQKGSSRTETEGERVELSSLTAFEKSLAEQTKKERQGKRESSCSAKNGERPFLGLRDSDYGTEIRNREREGGAAIRGRGRDGGPAKASQASATKFRTKYGERADDTTIGCLADSLILFSWHNITNVHTYIATLPFLAVRLDRTYVLHTHAHVRVPRQARARARASTTILASLA